jgi:hypothetical protein
MSASASQLQKHGAAGGHETLAAGQEAAPVPPPKRTPAPSAAAKCMGPESLPGKPLAAMRPSNAPRVSSVPIQPARRAPPPPRRRKRGAEVSSSAPPRGAPAAGAACEDGAPARRSRRAATRGGDGARRAADDEPSGVGSVSGCGPRRARFLNSSFIRGALAALGGQRWPRAARGSSRLGVSSSTSPRASAARPRQVLPAKPVRRAAVRRKRASSRRSG